MDGDGNPVTSKMGSWLPCAQLFGQLQARHFRHVMIQNQTRNG